MNFLKNFLFILAVASQMAFATGVTDEKILAPIAANPSNVTVVSSSMYKELTSRQKKLVWLEMRISELFKGAAMGEFFCSMLPEKSPYAVKAAVFTYVAFVTTMVEIILSDEKVAFDYCKKHRWLLLGL